MLGLSTWELIVQLPFDWSIISREVCFELMSTPHPLMTHCNNALHHRHVHGTARSALALDLLLSLQVLALVRRGWWCYCYKCDHRSGLSSTRMFLFLSRHYLILEPNHIFEYIITVHVQPMCTRHRCGIRIHVTHATHHSRLEPCSPCDGPIGCCVAGALGCASPRYGNGSIKLGRCYWSMYGQRSPSCVP